MLHTSTTKHLGSLIKFQSLLLLPLLILTYYVYSPGLNGDFIFDDYANLNLMAEYQPLNSTTNLLKYLQQSRPLSFLSFLIDDYTWPSQAQPFLHTNILLHLLNGCLLVWVNFRLLKLLGIARQKAELIAILAAILWLLHPLFVSTTLYVVQRMTLLSTLFTLLSLLSYLQGKRSLSRHNPYAYYWLYLGVVFFALLAFACKEIAALIPIYLLIIDRVLLTGGKPQPHQYRIWQWIYLYIPSTILALLLIRMSFDSGYSIRHFTVTERLLTEARVIFDYLILLLLPGTQSAGLHYENYLISTNIYTPLSTLFAIIGIFILFAISGFIRCAFPLLSFALLFFLSGHFIESTTIPLEIYFEHRNYLPAMFLFLALVFYLFKLLADSKSLLILTTLSLLIIFSTTTYLRSSLWGQPEILLLTWSANNPMSARTYQEGINLARRHNNPDLVEYFLHKGRHKLPENSALIFYQLFQSCSQYKQRNKLITQLKSVLSSTHEFKTKYIYLDLIRLIEERACASISEQELLSLMHASLNNPVVKKMPGRQQEIYYLLGVLHFQMQNYPKAYQLFNQSFIIKPYLNYLLKQSLMLAQAKQYALAVKHIQFGKKIIAKQANNAEPDQQTKWHYILELENKLQNKLKQSR